MAPEIECVNVQFGSSGVQYDLEYNGNLIGRITFFEGNDGVVGLMPGNHKPEIAKAVFSRFPGATILAGPGSRLLPF